MTKRPDEEPDLDDGLTTSERRRRRKRSGIRIPSDNVPRRSGSQPVIAPVPEDPALAVSIAYAFGDTSGGDTSGGGDAVPAGLDDLDDQTSIADMPMAMPDGSVLLPIDDVIPDGRTRQMAAISLEALGLSALDPDLLDADALASTQSMPTMSGELPATTAPMAAQADPTRITGEVEAVDIMVEDMAADPTADDADLARSGDGVPRRPMGRAATVALSEDDLEELMESTLQGSAPTAPPARAKGGTVPPLPPPSPPLPPPSPPSHQGVERIKPPTLPSLPVVGGPTATTAPSMAVVGMPPPMPTSASSSGSLASALSGSHVTPATSVSGTITTPPSITAVAPPPLDSVTVDASGAEPAAPGDASDSGEILAEEILEVEEQSRASAHDAFASVTTTPGAQPPPTERAITHPQLPVVPPPTPAAAAPAVIAPPPPPVVHKPPPPAPAPTRKPAVSVTPPSPMPGGDEKRKRRGKPWFEDLFDEDYLRTLPFLTPQATQAEATMVIESLGLQPGASVLDLGCGYGRHAMELAARGLNVVGVDLSLPMLLRGADEAQRRGLDINFMHADMREIDFDAQFDGAYCLFSTFGFFDDETNKKTASLVAKGLKPGAKLMLEVLNRDYVIGDLPNRVWWEGDGCVVLEEVEFNYFSSRVQSKRSVVFDDGRQVEQEISLRVYSLHEIGKLLHAAGLRVVEVSGSMATKGRFLGNRSREIIVIAERKSGDTKA